MKKNILIRKLSMFRFESNDKLKKFFAIFLFLCLLMPFAGSYCWLSHEKSMVKRQIKKQLASVYKEDLVCLQFSKKESQTVLEWEHEREFEYKGQMYDVVESNFKNDSVVYLCWLDHQETKLNKDLALLVTRIMDADPSNRQQKKDLVNFYLNLYCEQAQNINVVDNGVSDLVTRYKDIFFHSRSTSPTVPPPEII